MFEEGDFVADVVEILALNDEDLLLEEHLQRNLLLVLRGPLQILLKIAVHIDLLLSESGVPVVFNRVVAAAEKDIRDLGPVILERLVQDEEHPVLLRRPSTFLK